MTDHISLAKQIGKLSGNTVLVSVVNAQDSLRTALQHLNTDMQEGLMCKASTASVVDLSGKVDRLFSEINQAVEESHSAINENADTMTYHFGKHNERLNSLQTQCNELLLAVRKLQAEKLKPAPAPTVIQATELTAAQLKMLDARFGNWLAIGMVLAVATSLGLLAAFRPQAQRHPVAPVSQTAKVEQPQTPAPAPVSQPQVNTKVKNAK